MILERVTGKPYGEHLRESLFVPNGRRRRLLFVADHQASRERLNRGAANGLVNTDYIAWTCRTRRFDLLDGARPGEVDVAAPQRKLERDKSFATMTTPVKLTSGRPMSYGFGLSVDSVARTSHPSRRWHQRVHLGAGALP
jgi:CubicO group peptidase (beta-lactamase class C family)